MKPAAANPKDRRLAQAALGLAAAHAALKQHQGPRWGPDHEAKHTAWQTAYMALLKLANGYKKSEDQPA